MNRKDFLRQGMFAAGAIATLPVLRPTLENEIFDAEEIRAFVFAAHSDIEATKKIVEAKPLLLNCTNQFRKGDFETAIGGASHMGRKDIADLLVGKGARLDIFNLAFLGYSDLVRQLVTDFPQLLRAPGPHGFTLLHHAKVGKQEDLMAWLEEKGLTETHIKGVFGS